MYHTPSLAKWYTISLFNIISYLQAIALCHNVTPVYETTGEQTEDEEIELTEADQQSQQQVTYQASSPDEVTFV